MTYYSNRETAYPRLAPVDHPQALIRHLEYAGLRDRRVLGRVVADDPADRLADDARALVGEGLDAAEVAEEVALLLDLRGRRIEVAVVHVDRVGRREYALPARSQIHPWGRVMGARALYYLVFFFLYSNETCNLCGV